MRINLKNISLVNFKAVTQDFDFCEKSTRIGGKNGTGKTTLFDAFVWLLFGKSSSDKKDFTVATLDSNGEIIRDLQHSVTALLDVDGVSVTLQRIQVEKYKRDGSFKGSEQTRLIDGVEKSVSEFSVYISKLCDESVFKAITSPYWFTSQNWKVQREFLVSLIDESKIELSPDSLVLREKLKNQPIEHYRKALVSECKKIDSDIAAKKAVLADRKNEVKETAKDSIKSVRDEISAKNNKLSEIDDTIANIGKAKEEEYKAREKEILDLNSKITSARLEAQNAANKKVYEDRALKQKAEQCLQSLRRDIEIFNAQIADYEKKIALKNADIEALRADFKAINAEQLNFDESEFICPTCKRPLEFEDVEAKKAEMRENFNQSKAEKKRKNNEKGKQLSAEIKQLSAELESIIDEKEKKMVEELDASLNPILNAEIQAEIKVDDSDEIKALEAELAKLTESADIFQDNKIDSLQQNKASLQAELAELNRKLGELDAAEKAKSKIAALESEIKDLQTESVRIEGEIEALRDYQSEYFSQIEALVNSKFKYAKFKLFDTLVSGEQVEACEATYNGVPFSDLNNAARINIGLDIINTLCDAKNINAPIFIDNAESINEIIDTESQNISLYVTDHSRLTIL